MLPAKYRLKNRKNFDNLFQNGKTFSNEILIMKVNTGDKTKPSQFGFSVGLKFSKKSVIRNKIRRWMREAVRARIDKIKPGRKIAFFIKPKSIEHKLSFELIQEKIEDLLKKAKIL